MVLSASGEEARSEKRKIFRHSSVQRGVRGKWGDGPGEELRGDGANKDPRGPARDSASAGHHVPNLRRRLLEGLRGPAQAQRRSGRRHHREPESHFRLDRAARDQHPIGPSSGKRSGSTGRDRRGRRAARSRSNQPQSTASSTPCAPAAQRRWSGASWSRTSASRSGG